MSIPVLRSSGPLMVTRQHHGEEEHAEGNEALLAVSSSKGPTPKPSTMRSRNCLALVNHHLAEEELTILNPARTEVSEAARAELGDAFATERNAQIDAGCGRIQNVRKIVARAKSDGLLDESEHEEE